jgi:alpha-D-ribose 1-methylphosphonate 5-triphosphate synthase subunit PhnG
MPDFDHQFQRSNARMMAAGTPTERDSQKSPNGERRRWMAVLARATNAELAERLRACPELPHHVRLRGPETGLVMVRGRAGGAGAPFNFGEMSVTRCSVRIGANVGHAYVAGRDAAQAELAALIDAGLQDELLHPDLMRVVVEPLAAVQAARRSADAARAAATKVQFFTMATMRT